MSIDLPDAEEVAPDRTSGLRVAASLVGLGLVVGVLVAVGAIVFGGFAQTEAGLCRITPAPCTELSLGSVELLSGVDLPVGTEVVAGYASESASLTEFSAEVLLPLDAQSTLVSAYYPAEEGSLPGDGLSGVRYWSRSLPGASSTSEALDGTDASGRTVIRFASRIEP